MNELQKPTQSADNTTTDSAFKGYTLEELRYQRALVALQKEFCHTRLLRNLNNLQKSNPFLPAKENSTLPGKVGFIASKFFSGLNYLDYAMIGFSVFGTVRKIMSIFRKKKK